MELFSIRIRRTFQLVSTLDVTDIPQLHRMATAYDTYLRCLDVLAENGYTYNSGAIEVVEVPFNGKKVKVEFKRTEAGIFPVGWYEGKIRK